MSQSNTKYTEPETLSDVKIATIFTNSCVELLNRFNERIVELEAAGGSKDTHREEIDVSYSLVREESRDDALELNYQQKRNTDGEILNPITSEKADELVQQIERSLRNYHDERTGDPLQTDIAVDRLVIEIQDDTLQEMTGASTNTFDLEFESDKPDGPERRQIETLNNELGLTKQGFKLRSMNLHRMIETSEKYTGGDDTIIDWKGHTDIHPKSPRSVVQHIVQNHLPDYPFSDVSGCKVRGDQRLELAPSNTNTN